MLLSSFDRTNGTIKTPLLLFYSELGLVYIKVFGFVEYSPVRACKNVLKSAVNADRQAKQNPNANVDAEIVKLLGNSSFGYQIMDRSRFPVTRYLNAEKTHTTSNKKLFKRLGQINDYIYEVELAKSEIEHKEPIFVGFSIMEYANLRMFEL